nr:uncharacterized protein LOC118682517 [Bactrocera oleae]
MVSSTRTFLAFSVSRAVSLVRILLESSWFLGDINDYLKTSHTQWYTSKTESVHSNSYLDMRLLMWNIFRLIVHQTIKQYYGVLIGRFRMMIVSYHDDTSLQRNTN